MLLFLFPYITIIDPRERPVPPRGTVWLCPECIQSPLGRDSPAPLFTLCAPGACLETVWLGPVRIQSSDRPARSATGYRPGDPVSGLGSLPYLCQKRLPTIRRAKLHRSHLQWGLMPIGQCGSGFVLPG